MAADVRSRQGRRAKYIFPRKPGQEVRIMDDRAIPVPRCSVVRLCESSRYQRQLLAQAYQHVFPQIPRSLTGAKVAPRACAAPWSARPLTAARVAAGA
jgi:hypothetical protein